jgi:cobalt transporter subunit CbtA
MVRESLLTALVAGFVAAIFLTVVQSIWITPLILQAETYEEAPETHGAEAHSADTHGEGAPVSTPAAHHHHDEDDWKPRNGWQRTAFTLASNLLLGVGYGLVLVALFLLWREPRSSGWGVAYGIAGFAVFFAAPSWGLPPELPGTAAAELLARQEWWVLTAGATAAGLLLFFSRRKPAWRVLAIAIILAPHFIPAPHPAVEGSLAPASLQTEFRLATTIANALFWLLLGLVSAVAYRRLGLARTK